MTRDARTPLEERALALLADGERHGLRELAAATGSGIADVRVCLKTARRRLGLVAEDGRRGPAWWWRDPSAAPRRRPATATTDITAGKVQIDPARTLEDIVTDRKTPTLPRPGTRGRRVLDALAAFGRPAAATDLHVEGMTTTTVSQALSELYRAGRCSRDGEPGGRGDDSGRGYRYWPAIEVPGVVPAPFAADDGTPDVQDGTPDVPSAEDDGKTDDPQATIERLTRERDAAREVVARCAAAAGHDLDDGTGYDGLVDHIAYVVETRRHAERQLASATAKLNARTAEVEDLADRLRRIAEAARVDHDDGLPTADEIVERIRELRAAWRGACDPIESQPAPAAGRKIDIDHPDDLVALWSALDRLSERLPADVALTPARDLVMVLSQYASGRAA
jgi:hypothetical protein